MKKLKRIDLNCDVGEGLENEKDLFPFISSCSIACGGHAGNEETMKRVVTLAVRQGVRIGAHPSYPDRANFGRESQHLPESELVNSIREQIDALLRIIDEAGANLHHIKPHGALYNDLARDAGLARIFLKAIRPYKDTVKLYAPDGSAIAREAEKAGWPVACEAFGDRNYNDDLSLVSRSSPSALIRDPKKVLAHILPIVGEGKVITLNGKVKPISAETVCIHGDTDNVLEILMYLSREIPKNNLLIK